MILLKKYFAALQAVQKLEGEIDNEVLDYEPIILAIQGIGASKHCLRYPMEIEILVNMYLANNFIPDPKYIRAMLSTSIHVNQLVGAQND